MKVRILGALLAFLVAAPQALAGVVLHACNLTGEIHQECCCCDDENSETGPVTASVQQPPCCDSQQSAVMHLPASLISADQSPAPPAWAVGAAGIEINRPKLVGSLMLGQARAPPRSGPALYIHYQAFLL
jgi:hypothetical protein